MVLHFLRPLYILVDGSESNGGGRREIKMLQMGNEGVGREEIKAAEGASRRKRRRKGLKEWRKGWERKEARKRGGMKKRERKRREQKKTTEAAVRKWRGGCGGGKHAWGYVLDFTSCRKWFPGSADVPLGFFSSLSRSLSPSLALSLSRSLGAATFECRVVIFFFSNLPGNIGAITSLQFYILLFPSSPHSIFVKVA